MSAFAVAIGAKRTWVGAPHMSAFDPKRTHRPGALELNRLVTSLLSGGHHRSWATDLVTVHPGKGARA